MTGRREVMNHDIQEKRKVSDVKNEELREFFEKIVKEQEDIPTEFQKIITEHFWDMVNS